MEVKPDHALPPGYKQTEVGVIPEDWGTRSLGEIGEALIGLTYSPSNVSSDGLLVLRSSNIVDGRLSFNDNVFVQVDVPERIIVRNGDILICVRNGSRALIGKCAKIDKRAEGMTFGAFMAVFRTDHPDYIFYQFQSSIVDRQIQAHLGATINQITNTSLNSFRVPLPPTLAEQQAIAEALSDADALSEALEKLIAKKRQVKQGAMQELLTGQRRLPGFGGEWNLRTLAELSGSSENIVDGPFGSNLKSADYVVSGVPVLQGINITDDKFTWRDVRYISERKAAQLYRSNAKPGDLLSVKIGSVGYSALIPHLEGHEFAIIPANLLRIRFSNERFDPTYIYYALVSNAGKRQLLDLAGNTAQPALGLTLFRQVSLYVSPNRAEQTAIASILSDMDAEVAALEARLAKARLVKQGMMQELLTGRIRLV